MRLLLLAILAFTISSATTQAQERLPQQVAGTWRIVRILPVHRTTCWTESQAEPLVGSLLQYSPRQMKWRGGVVPLTGVTTRTVTSDDLATEPGVPDQSSLKLADLGIRARGVIEVNMQHDDADVTGSTTEVPGDSVLVAGPGRIVVSACGVYMEARRVSAAGHGATEGDRKGL